MSSAKRSERRPSFLTSSSLLGSPNPNSIISIASAPQSSTKGGRTSGLSMSMNASMGPPSTTLRSRATSFTNVQHTPHTPRMQLERSFDSIQDKPYTPLSSRRVVTGSPSSSSVGRVHEDDDRKLSHKRELELEMDRVRVLQAELCLEREKRREFEDRALRAEQSFQRSRSLETRTADLEKMLEEKAVEVSNLNKRRAQLEENILQLQTSGSGKVLEGRLAGAQSLLAEKNSALEDERAAHMRATMQIEEITSELSAKSVLLSQLERQIGQKGAILETSQSTISRMQSSVDTMGQELASQIEKCNQMEQGQLMTEAQKTRVESELREELRVRNRHAHTLESKIKELTEENERQVARTEILQQKISQQEEIMTANSGRREHLNKERESLEADNSQKSVLLEGVRMELEREIQRSKKIADDLRASDAQVDELESKLREAQTSLARKSALESKLEVLEGALARNEQDFDAELLRHKQTKQRVQELEEKSSQIPWLQKNVKELEADNAVKQDAINQLKKSDTKKLTQQDDAKVALSLQEARVREYEEEVKHLVAERDELQCRISDLEVEAMRKSGIEGKAKGLQSVVEQRASEVDDLTNRNNALMNRLRDAEMEMESYARLRADISQAQAGKQELELEIERLQNAVHVSERDAERQKQALRDSEEIVHDYSERIRHHEHTILDLKQEVAHKAVLHDQFEDSRVALHRSTSDLQATSSQLEVVEAKAALLQQEKARHEARIESLEAKMEQEVEHIQELQVEMGAKSMEVENFESEMAKLGKELEWKTQQYELLSDQHKRLKEETTVKTEAVTRLEDREKRRSDLVENLRREINEQQVSIDTQETALRQEKEKRTAAERKIVSLEESAATVSLLEGKIEALEEMHLTQSQEYAASQKQVSDLKNKLKTTEVDSASAHKLQEHFESLREQAMSQASVIEALEVSDIKKTNIISDLHKDAEKLQEAEATLQKVLEEEKANSAVREEKLAMLEVEHGKRSQLEGRIAGLETVLGNKEADLTNAVEQNNALLTKIKLIEKSSNDKSILEDKINLLEHEVLTQKDVISRLESQDARRREVEQSLRVEVEAEEGKLRLLENELHNQTQSRFDLEHRLKMVEEEAEELLKESNSEKNELKEQICTLQLGKRTLEEAVQQDTASNRRAQEKLLTLAQENKSLMESVAAIEEEKGKMDVEFREAVRTLDIEKAEKAALQEMAIEYKDKVLTMEKKVKMSTSSAVTTENRLTTDLRLKEQQVENLESAVNELRRELTEKTRRLQDKTECLSKEQDRVLDAERKARDIHEQAILQQRSMQDTETRLGEMQKQQATVMQLKEEIAVALQHKEHALQDVMKQVHVYKKRAEQEQTAAASLKRSLAESEADLHAYEERVREMERRLTNFDSESAAKVAGLEAERGENEATAALLKRELHEQLEASREKERNYKKTITALTQKCTLADETLSKFEDFSTYNGQLRESNTRLREELEGSRQELEVTRDQVLDLQAQLSRSIHKFG
eukprot:TRINITY_DN689_c2_g1_i2.p1 TRINITY_DN689_c2_g1~~TRINITY_DN689_c2_g1_i2.p1  ORF type:complete len:1503 (+),score=529.18 TRINITY_DN689_c2_g1_i2:39-4547(+)